MKLKKLLKNIPTIDVKGSREIEITGLCCNSKLVAPGNIFVAKRGYQSDGNRFIPEAISAGAVAVLTDIFDPSLRGVVQLIHPDVVTTEALLAVHYYEFPTDALFTVGVTGTSGKTTTTLLIKHLLDSIGQSCGLIGTIENIIGEHRYSAKLTTPDVVANHKMLRDMVNHGCTAAAMEVTSHGLFQGRIDHIDFDVAIYTNLSLDHLDYHKTMEEYADAKNILFRRLGQQHRKAQKPIAVVNIDDPWHERVLKGCSCRQLTYGLSPAADLRATNISLTPSATTFTVSYNGSSVQMKWPLIGRFNVYNGLAAMAVGIVKGLSLEEIAKVLAVAPGVRGRMEVVPNPLNLNVYVDYAHKPDALRKVLECLREVCHGKIIAVFGCGGDRDRSKRPEMARACEELSDMSIVTSDNPRSENPLSICEEIIQGYKNKTHYVLEIDRRIAIKKALQLAQPGDTVLVAGKGHETSQTFLHHTISFDDREVVKELCTEMV